MRTSVFGRARALTLSSLLTLSLAGAACAARPPGPSTPTPSDGPARAVPIALEQATHYETTPAKRGLRGDAADAELARSLASAAKSTGLVADGRLAELALGIAATSDRALRAPSYALVSYHAQRAGIAEPTPQVWLAGGASVVALLPAVARAIQEATRSGRLTHIGAAAIHLDPLQPQAGVVIALALSTRRLTLRTPVPRSVPVGSVIHLVGELAAGHSQPVLAVTREAGITRMPLGPSRRFRRDIPATRPGELTLELLASGPEGLTVVALMPVMVGAPVASEPPAFHAPETEASAQEVSQKLLSLIASERAQRKLPPLRTDARLTKIALAHSQDMLSHDFIAHTSKSTGDATARVNTAGLAASLVLENIGRGYSASELHEGLMASPGHRANILHPDARQLGIGVVEQREGDRKAFLVTELFTQLR
ncbi:MAG: hypothetical protein JWN48_4486 [Myxococcaceae bacterium]|nr:hypothetical protein [Myxococcaceae bacterium]